MRRSILAAVLAAASFAVVAAGASWGAQLQQYSAREVLSLAYGDAEGSPGLLDEGGEAVTPSSIAIDRAGRVAIADPAKRRLAFFDRWSGSYLTSVPIEGVPIDAVPEDSGVAVLTSAKQVLMMDGHGRKQLSQQVSEDVSGDGLRRLSAAKGFVWAETGRGDSYQVASVKDVKGVPERAQAGTRSRGTYARDAAFDRYAADGGRVVRYGADGNPDLEVRLGQEDLVGVDVVGTDASGAFYVILEIGTDAGSRTECRKYSSAGVLLARFDVASDRAWTARGTVVDADGTLYRLVVDEQRARVIAYSPGGDS